MHVFETVYGFSAAAGQKNGQSNRIRNYIFVINGVVSYERFRVQGLRVLGSGGAVHPVPKPSYENSLNDD